MKIFTRIMALAVAGVATGATAQTVPTVSTADAPVYYVIKSYDRGGVLTSVEGTSNLRHVSQNVNHSLWQFIATDDNTEGTVANGVKVKNIAGYYLQNNATTTDAAVATTFYILPNGYNENGLCLSKTAAISTNSCLDASNTDTGIGVWNPRSEKDWQGTTWVFETPAAFTTENITALKSTYANYIGEGYGKGNYSTEITNAEQLSNTADASATALLTALKSATTTPFAFTLPQAGAFLRIKASSVNAADQPYVFAEASDVTANRVKLATADANEVKTILYYDGTTLTGFANGYQLRNQQPGKLGQAIFSGTTAGTTVEFVPSTGTPGTYLINYDKSSARLRYLYNNGSTGAYYGDVNSTEAAKTRFDLEAVTTLPVTITAAGYATLNVPATLSIPAGVTAYKMSVDAANQLVNLTKIEGTIPAGTPVVLKGDAATYNFNITATTGAAATADNTVAGTIKAIDKPSTGSIYTLQRIDGETGFFKLSDGATIGGFKAYITLPAGSAVRGLSFNDTATGIAGIEADTKADNTFYDLSGRRVTNPTSGIYVVAGRKVIIK